MFAGHYSAACAVGVQVTSHGVLDWVVHRPDLTVGWTGTKLGLAIWNHPIAAYLLEVGLVAVSVWLCVRSCGIPGRESRRWLGLAVVLVGLQTATSFGPLPTSLASMIGSALVVYLAVPWLGSRVDEGTTT